MKIVPALLFFLVFCTGVAGAGAEQQINERLKAGGTVYLQAGVYETEGPIIIGSNTILTGDPDAIIKVFSSSSQWFTGSTGIISCRESVKNVEIYGFQINGNLGAFPASYANMAGHDKDCMRCIILHGNSGDYADNIRIHDMKLYDSFSDGMYIYGSSLFLMDKMLFQFTRIGFCDDIHTKQRRAIFIMQKMDSVPKSSDFCIS